MNCALAYALAGILKRRGPCATPFSPCAASCFSTAISSSISASTSTDNDDYKGVSINVASHLARRNEWQKVEIVRCHSSASDVNLCSVPLLLSSKVTFCNSWPAFKNDKWSISNLRKYYGKSLFECGKNGLKDNEPIIRSLNNFLDICKNEERQEVLKDIISIKGSDSYLFDSTFEFDCKDLALDYRIPDLFNHDMVDFETLPEQAEPLNYKWFLLGAKFSGSPFHIDPLHTSAWNTLVQGKKHWIVVNPDQIIGENDANINNSTDPGDVLYDSYTSPKEFFTNVLPHMLISSYLLPSHVEISAIDLFKAYINDDCNDGWKSNIDSSLSKIVAGLQSTSPINNNNDLLPTASKSNMTVNVANERPRCRVFYYFVQMPGETVYIPHGWLHSVFNSEISVAVTHNFVKKSDEGQMRRFKAALDGRWSSARHAS